MPFKCVQARAKCTQGRQRRFGDAMTSRHNTWLLQKYRGVVHSAVPPIARAVHNNYTKYSTCVPMSHRFSVTVRINLGSISSRSLPLVSGTNITTNIRPMHEMSAYSQNAPCSPSPSCCRENQSGLVLAFSRVQCNASLPQSRRTSSR